MPDDINTRVSLSLDPEMYREVEGYNDETRGFVDHVINAFNDAYITVGKLWEARDAANATPGWTEELRILNVQRVAEKHRARVAKRFDLAHRDLLATISHTEGELSRPLTERAGMGTLNGEVRAYVAKLDRPKRSAFMAEALERDDGPTLEAVLGAQPFLSGLTAIDHAHFTRMYHERKNPHLVRRLDVMNRFREKLDRIGPILREQFDKPVGAKPNVASAISAAHDRVEAALKIEPTG